MGKEIIIVHQAEIVRKGLSAILEDLHTIKVSCFSDLYDLGAKDYSNVKKLMLFIPVSCRLTDQLLGLRTKVGDHELIGLMGSETEKYDSNIFDRVLPLNVSAERVRELAGHFFEHNLQDINDELTSREKEVLRLIAMGKTNKAIAETLFISAHTVISHRKNITEKLGIKSIPGLTVYAIIQRIIDPADISHDQLS